MAHKSVSANKSMRNRDISRVGHIYTPESPYGEDVCVYCGDLACTVDHVVPVAYLTSLGDFRDEWLAKHPRAARTVPACMDCNVRLGSFIGTSISQKREMLKRRLRKKHKNLLNSYDWQDEELSELGYSLRVFIKGKEQLRDHVMLRLSFPKPGEARFLRSFG